MPRRSCSGISYAWIASILLATIVCFQQVSNPTATTNISSRCLDVHSGRQSRAVVTASSPNHFDVLLGFLESYSQNNPLSVPLLVYSLRLTDQQFDSLLSNFPFVHARKFDFSSYPEYFDVRVARGEYAWKPIIIKEVLDSFAEKVLWLDSGDRLTSPEALARCFQHIDNLGYVTTQTSGTTQTWVHPSTLKYFGEESLDLPMCNGAIIGFDGSQRKIYEEIVSEWAHCAVTRECIAPRGSSRLNHRQDQAALSVLIHKASLRCDLSEGTWIGGQMVPGDLMIQFHQDTFSNAFNPVSSADDTYCGSTFEVDQKRIFGFEDMHACLNTSVGHRPLRVHPLYGNPDLQGGGRGEPLVALDVQRKNRPTVPSMTVIMSVYNSAEAISQSLPALFKSAAGDWELILVLDACYDHSLDVARVQISENIRDSSCVRARIISQPTAIWETSSDNLGMSISDPSDAYILVQADNIITESNWNTRMLEALQSDKTLLGVGGRCGHSRDGSSKVGRCGVDIGDSLPAGTDMSKLHYRETVNRGPLMFHARFIQELGFFDETRFFLGDDDHDLCFRASEQGRKVAYLPVGFVAPMHLRTQNKENIFTPPEILQKEREYKSYREAMAASRM